MTRVKVCGITRREDAELAIELGASAVGMVREPSSPRYVKAIPAWWRSLPPFVVRVAVYGPFSGEEVPEAFDRFQAITWSGEAPHLDRRIQVVRSDPVDPQESSTILVDAHSQHSYGGTGTLADWDLARRLVESSGRPVILAGGLTPENVGEAITKVQPWAVDVSSGIESEPGVKDRKLLLAFFRHVK